MKKFFLSLFIILVLAAAGFVWGWVQLFVPQGSAGVLITKTGGIKTDPIIAGSDGFTWYWERLLPTNTRLMVFELSPKTFSHKISGTLPSAEIYSKLSAGEPNFDYSIETEITMALKTECLPQLCEKFNLKNQDDLNLLFETQGKIIAQKACQAALELSLVEENTSEKDSARVFAVKSEDILAKIDLSDLDFLEIFLVEVKNASLPDIKLYQNARATYQAYQAQADQIIARTKLEENALAAAEYAEIEHYKKIGKLLNEYPILLEYFAVQKDDLPKAFEELNTVKSYRAEQAGSGKTAANQPKSPAQNTGKSEPAKNEPAAQPAPVQGENSAPEVQNNSAEENKTPVTSEESL